MKTIQTGLDGLVVIEPDIFRDDRGFFLETYNRQQFRDLGITVDFVQDNHSRSGKGVLRGIHYQGAPASQAKLVSCTAGSVYDVAVDLRADSRTLGQWRAAELDAENLKQLFIPVGFGHAFLVLSDWAEVRYKASAFYAPHTEGAISWDDADLGIVWPSKNPVLSRKDEDAPSMQAYLRSPASVTGSR